MNREERREPCLDLFWEQADADSAAEHPLERELLHRVDAVQRYERLIADALGAGRSEVVRSLTEQCDRQQQLVRQLRRALARLPGQQRHRD